MTTPAPAAESATIATLETPVYGCVRGSVVAAPSAGVEIGVAVVVDDVALEDLTDEVETGATVEL